MRTPDPRAVRMLAAMLDSARARHDAARLIPPGWWPDEASRRIAAQLIDGGKLKPADPETDRLEVAYWLAIARAEPEPEPEPEPDAIVAMLAERERVYLLGRELGCLAGRFTGGFVGSMRQAKSETIDALRIARRLDTRMAALAVAGGSA